MMNNTKKFGAFAAIAALVVMCACTAGAVEWTGKFVVEEDSSGIIDIAHTADATVFQTDYAVKSSATYAWFGTNENKAVYLLEGGSFTGNVLQAYGQYASFRQMGGDSYVSTWKRPGPENNENTLPFDFLYGGSANAYARLYEGDGSTDPYLNNMFSGPMNLIVKDDAKVFAGLLRADPYFRGFDGNYYKRVIALNGGELTMSTREGSRDVCFAFNGGTLRTMDGYTGGAYMFGVNIPHPRSASVIDAWVRVYEGGGCIVHHSSGTGDGTYLRPPAILAPKDNVVLSIPIPEGHELETRTWQMPPAVVITDSTGEGSNAVAVVDYDFDSGKVTNITVVCRGENYSGDDNAVTANLKYSATGEALLSEPLVCNVGPAQSGSFTFACNGSGYGYQIQYVTNTYHGATIVDADLNGDYDHPASGTSAANTRHMLSVEGGRAARFFNTTSVVIRTGLLIVGSLDFHVVFPDVVRLELYGGHIGRINNNTFKDVVVGGETWLRNYTASASTAVRVAADGTLTVDYGAVVTNDVIVTPTLKYGTVTFNAGAKIALKVRDWSKLPRGKKVPVLDLSGVTTFTTRDMATLLQPEDGKIAWGSGDDAKILYARRNADGMMMIFR